MSFYSSKRRWSSTNPAPRYCFRLTRHPGTRNQKYDPHRPHVWFAWARTIRNGRVRSEKIYWLCPGQRALKFKTVTAVERYLTK